MSASAMGTTLLYLWATGLARHKRTKKGRLKEQNDKIMCSHALTGHIKIVFVIKKHRETQKTAFMSFYDVLFTAWCSCLIII